MAECAGSRWAVPPGRDMRADLPELLEKGMPVCVGLEDVLIVHMRRAVFGYRAVNIGYREAVQYRRRLAEVCIGAPPFRETVLRKGCKHQMSAWPQERREFRK